MTSLKTLQGFFIKQFPALKHQNYRLYFAGQLISFTGSWLHGVAYGWLIYTLTHSALWLGLASAVSAIPVLVLTLFGGFLVDRLNRRKLLIFTQSFSLILALILGILTITGIINIFTLIAISFLSGVVNALDNSASQAFVVDIVSQEDLPSAIGLNSTMFNTGRVLGPAVAGFLIAIVGIGNIFLINALSFFAILLSLYFININCRVTIKDDRPINAITDGIKYSIDHPIIGVLLLTAAIGSLFCFSQATIMPVIAERVFGDGSSALGYLLSATGLGALTGSIFISSKSAKIKAFYLIALGYTVFLISTFIFSFISNFYLASVLLFASGFGLTLQFSTIYTTIQKMVKEEYRGRVSSIYVLMFIGISPIGNIFIGLTTNLVGPQMAIRLCSFIVLLYGIFVFFNLKMIKNRFYHYQQKFKSAYVYLES